LLRQSAAMTDRDFWKVASRGTGDTVTTTSVAGFISRRSPNRLLQVTGDLLWLLHGGTLVPCEGRVALELSHGIGSALVVEYLRAPYRIDDDRLSPLDEVPDFLRVMLAQRPDQIHEIRGREFLAGSQVPDALDSRHVGERLWMFWAKQEPTVTIVAPGRMSRFVGRPRIR